MDDREKNNSIELSADTARMLRNVGSAMREALNGSMAAAELLGRRLEQEGRESERDYLAVMRHDQHRLLRIAENLTELGELTLGEARAEQSVQDLNQICGELVDTVSALTDRVRLEFTPCRESCGVNGSIPRVRALRSSRSPAGPKSKRMLREPDSTCRLSPWAHSAEPQARFSVSTVTVMAQSGLRPPQR